MDRYTVGVAIYTGFLVLRSVLIICSFHVRYIQKEKKKVVEREREDCIVSTEKKWDIYTPP